MLIEQMHELAPHISLAPDYVDLSSDEGGDDTYNRYIHGAGSGSYLDNNNNGHRHLHHDPRRRMSTAGSDNNVPSSSINYFSGQLFGLNSGLDFESDLSPVGSTSTLSGSMNSKKGSNGRTAARDGLIDGSTKGKQEKQVMLDPEQAREEEARIEEEQRAKERTKSYNPDNVKVRIVSVETDLTQ